MKRENGEEKRSGKNENSERKIVQGENEREEKMERKREGKTMIHDIEQYKINRYFQIKNLPIDLWRRDIYEVIKKKGDVVRVKTSDQ